MMGEVEVVDCRECGAAFNLAAQNYYDNICPSCIDESRTWPICPKCDERIPPDEKGYRTVPGAPRDPSTVQIPYHERCLPNTTRGP